MKKQERDPARTLAEAQALAAAQHHWRELATPSLNTHPS
jgi:hypothetical protein